MEEVVARLFQLFLALAGAYALALWFALVVWTYRDISLRSSNTVTHIFSTLVVVLFFVPGAIIYLILRPRETLDESFQRTMEEEYLLQDLDDFPLCPACRRSVREEFIYCPHCSVELRQPCVNCRRLVDLRWEACAFCGAAQFETPLPVVVPASVETTRKRPRKRQSNKLQSIDGGRSAVRKSTDAVILPETDSAVAESPPFREPVDREEPLVVSSEPIHLDASPAETLARPRPRRSIRDHAARDRD